MYFQTFPIPEIPVCVLKTRKMKNFDRKNYLTIRTEKLMIKSMNMIDENSQIIFGTA